MQQQAPVNPENPNNDIPVVAPPQDSISCLAFSPSANILAAGSWNREVRVWDVNANGQTVPKGMKQFGGPILSIDFTTDSQFLFAAGCDKTVQMWNVATNQVMPVAQHDAPVKCVKWSQDLKMLVTGSWDKTVRFWDCRTPKAAFIINTPDRVYAMDCTAPLLTVATANRKVIMYDTQKLQQPRRTLDSPLKFQTRSIANFMSKDGFAIGSIEGRVAIQHVDERSQKNFSFKCHREERQGNDGKPFSFVYSVNSIAFHPMGTFATCGSDGAYTFWDKDSKQRLKMFKNANQPVTAGAFNATGTIFAYALSYDWSKGVQYYDPKRQPSIFLHGVLNEEIAPRPKQG